MINNEIQNMNTSNPEINGNNNTVNIDNSVNITYNIIVNINQRENLKELNNGQSYEFTMMYINQVHYLKKKGYEYAICSNVCHDYQFISDHVHVRFKYNIISDFFRHKIINAIGKVYKYERKDGTIDYAINVDEIINVSDRLPFCKFNIHDKITNIEVFDEVLNNFSDDNIYDIVQNQLTMLDMSLKFDDFQVKPGFISGIILTRYFLNTQLRSLVNQQSVLRNANRDCLIDIFKLTSNILYEMDKCKMYKWCHLISKLNETCNYLQGVETLEFKDEKIERLVNDNITTFGEKIDFNMHNKLFRMCKLYNKNYGFNYPENVEEFESKLRERVLCYMVTKGYVKLKR